MNGPDEGNDAVDDAEIELPEFFGDDDAADAFDELELADPGEEPDGAPDAGAEAEDVEDDGAAAASSGSPKTVPYTRLQKVIAQRNEARERLEELERTESELRAELSGEKAFRETVAQRYGRFRNPNAQLAIDADFMSALEELAKTDGDVGKFYKKVTDYMSTGNRQPTVETKAEPQVDKRVERIVEKQARVQVAEVLGPLKLQPKYVRLIENHVVQNAKDLADLDSAAVKKLAKAWIADNGFTLDEMRPVKTDAKAKDKPPTGRQNAPAAAQNKSGKKAEAKPKTREEWLESRAKNIDSIIAELMPSQP